MKGSSPVLSTMSPSKWNRTYTLSILENFPFQLLPFPVLVVSPPSPKEGRDWMKPDNAQEQAEVELESILKTFYCPSKLY